MQNKEPVNSFYQTPEEDNHIDYDFLFNSFTAEMSNIIIDSSILIDNHLINDCKSLSISDKFLANNFILSDIYKN